mgnify:FL=1
MERENEDLIYDVENTIKLYEKCNCRIANVTRDMLDRLGYQKALAKLVVSADIQKGFKCLIEHGYINNTFEALIVKYANLFSKSEVDAAKFRLENYKEL